MEVPYRGSGEVYVNEKAYRCDLYYSKNQGGIILRQYRTEKSARYRQV